MDRAADVLQTWCRFIPTYPKECATPRKEDPQSTIHAMKDYLYDSQFRLKKSSNILAQHVDRLMDLRSEIENFAKLIGEMHKLDEGWQDKPSSSRRRQTTDFFNFAASPAGSGIPAWDSLAYCLHEEAEMVPSMKDVLHGWSAYAYYIHIAP
eukprot:CAMPEP_0170184964 /NCGR_PEP_ID=MMETSP0040_2-20121228/35204_1 /TAXON_ID=641309 /ORGANISM="Lotharella oceanica, Strain CCMP622" /LENGTH=151 /DNA_ID=CAMNT_0010431197 /DNA_START=163 /DNA_END=618 /DNA_ORIENTATION=+